MNTIGTSVDALGIVEAIVQYSKGFICGERMGVVSLYEKAESGEFHYKKVFLLLLYFVVGCVSLNIE